MLTPSYDFNLFGLDQFSPLMANEFGAGTSFSASDPASYVDNSLNQLSGLLQPFNPLPYVQQQFPALIQPQAPFSFFNPQVPISPSIPGKPTTVTGTGNTTVNVYTPAPAAQQQQTGMKKCDPNQTWYERIYAVMTGKCCPYTIDAQGRCVLQSIDESVGDDPTHSGKKVATIFELLGFTDQESIGQFLWFGLAFFLVLIAIVLLRR